MEAFLAHVERCVTCRRYPRDPCAEGVRLLREGARRLAEQIAPTPKPRGQA